MNIARQLAREQGPQALWRRCLGFLDWTAEQTVEEQKRSLRQQLQSAAESPLARRLLAGQQLESAAQLREQVPLTEYEDYADTLGARRDDSLSAPAALWLRTSGRATGGAKWIPVSHAAKRELGWSMLGLLLAARAREHGDVRLPSEISVLNLTAPPPYFSGSAVAAFDELGLWPVRLHPPNDPAVDALPFEERMARGFAAAARRGVDFAVSYSSVLAGVSGSLSRRAPMRSSASSTDARLVARMARARLRAWFQRRALLPRDVWSPKAIIGGGMDAALFRDQICEEWGCDPLESLASTDGLFLGMQTWERSTTTLIPHFNFFEFIPQRELIDEGAWTGHTPRTLLMDELSVGDAYELVITNLLGGALIRYRTGELVRLSAASNLDAGVRLPQFLYEGQRSELVEVAGFVRLSEMTFARALEAADLPVSNWTARKEVHDGRPVVRMWLELPTTGDAEELAARVSAELRRLDDDWRDMEDFAGIHPLRVTVAPTGTFAQCSESGLAGRPAVPRVNASDHMIATLEGAAQTAAGLGRSSD